MAKKGKRQSDTDDETRQAPVTGDVPRTVLVGTWDEKTGRIIPAAQPRKPKPGGA